MCCRFILGVLSKQTVVMAVLQASGGFIGEGAHGKGGKDTAVTRIVHVRRACLLLAGSADRCWEGAAAQKMQVLCILDKPLRPYFAKRTKRLRQ